jgi:hypothetical protein
MITFEEFTQLDWTLDAKIFKLRTRERYFINTQRAIVRYFHEPDNTKLIYRDAYSSFGGWWREVEADHKIDIDKYIYDYKEVDE